MKPTPPDDASLPTDGPGLEAQIEELEERQRLCKLHIRQLMDSEDPANGVHHAEAIHDAKQLAMTLQYQRELRVVRLNALKHSEGWY